MITKLKAQIEEDKRIEEALKKQLEGKDRIIGNMEVEIVILRRTKFAHTRIIQNTWNITK
jgi:hypothetical protein